MNSAKVRSPHVVININIFYFKKSPTVIAGVVVWPHTEPGEEEAQLGGVQCAADWGGQACCWSVCWPAQPGIIVTDSRQEGRTSQHLPTLSINITRIFEAFVLTNLYNNY